MEPDGTAPDESLTLLLEALLEAGESPDRALLDGIKAYGGAAVPPLLDVLESARQRHAPDDSPRSWAPLHAVALLGELGAAEAVDALQKLSIECGDDDYMTEALSVAFTAIGAPAVAPLCAVVADRGLNVWVRARAIEALSGIGERYPDSRGAIVATLVARLAPEETRVPDDEMLNAYAITGIAALEAKEGADAAQRALEED